MRFGLTSVTQGLCQGYPTGEYGRQGAASTGKGEMLSEHMPATVTVLFFFVLKMEQIVGPRGGGFKSVMETREKQQQEGKTCNTSPSHSESIHLSLKELPRSCDGVLQGVRLVSIRDDGLALILLSPTTSTGLRGCLGTESIYSLGPVSTCRDAAAPAGRSKENH
ncbi:unnamed protein product [Pleuronectes platessa]|uniref:Uncharacterized protein n=1 Tax=Pleuronectes platessa TaxID=8262 RepID=A0A9N7YTT7_PLEPL|nr:unnamed protein product [Pleuronectes platessa]